MTDTSRSTILIVDDTPLNISLLNAALMDEYDIKAATSGAKAIEICQSVPIDIILLDVMMPGMDGFETCRRLKEHPLTRNKPVIFVTAKDEIKDESMGFDCGAVDYIAKPIRAPIVRSRVRTHLALYNQNRTLEHLVRERTAKLDETRLEILNRLGSAGEMRDNETGLHVVRVCHYCQIIARTIGLPENEVGLLFSTAGLHDIGKIGIPDSILLKPGKLDEDEWKIMRTHSEIGHRILGPNPDSLIQSAAIIALTHHERWDGTGYPNGLSGSKIPLFGRIVPVADVFDALTSERPYKKAWPISEAIEEVARCSGHHFDPQIVDAFLNKMHEVTEVCQKFADAV